MGKMIKAEWIKQKRNKAIISLNIITFLIVVGLYMWSAFVANGDALQLELRQSSIAGAYGLVIFITVCRKMWAILFGFFLVNMELIENRSDFYIQNLDRRKLWFTKIMYGVIVAFELIIISYIIPFLMSSLVSGEFELGISIGKIVFQLFIVWLITIGNIVLGMMLALIFKDTTIIAILVFTLEYFSNIYPKFILCIWEKVDGYWYISNYLKPFKEQLSKLNNFIFSLSEGFSGIYGIVIWLFVLSGIMLFSMYIFEKKEF